MPPPRPAVQVSVVDLNAERIAAWNDADLAQLPLVEPGLDAQADMVIISVNTPTRTRPPVATREKGTLPVRTAAVIQQILGSAECAGSAGDQPGRTFSVLSSPEFLAETVPRRSARPPGRMCAKWPRRSGRTAASPLRLA